MGGGLMQLVAYGAQDIYLTGNPQITFFKVVYRRHTNFSMEAIQQTWNGSPADGATFRASATISRNGDLVSRLYIEVVGLDTTSGGEANPGAILVDSVECEVGGQLIEKHYGHWMEVWAELTEPNIQGFVKTASSTAGTLFQNMSVMGGCAAGNTSDTVTSFIPLRFWFCENAGLALPLIALQYHEVKIILNGGSVVDGAADCKLWADYIYLDTDERRRFAQVSHEYLITQVQHQQIAANASEELNFNHPVKELVWTGGWGSGLNTALTAAQTYQLKLNGHDRFAARDRTYFTRTQVWQHHTGYGGLTATAGASQGNDSIAVYSFALKPEEHQPSGTCNFSRIDNAQLVQGSGSKQACNVYAVNYNVLRIMSGMGGLAYSN